MATRIIPDRDGPDLLRHLIGLAGREALMRSAHAGDRSRGVVGERDWTRPGAPRFAYRVASLGFGRDPHGDPAVLVSIRRRPRRGALWSPSATATLILQAADGGAWHVGVLRRCGDAWAPAKPLFPSRRLRSAVRTHYRHAALAAKGKQPPPRDPTWRYHFVGEFLAMAA